MELLAYSGGNRLNAKEFPLAHQGQNRYVPLFDTYDGESNSRPGCADRDSNPGLGVGNA
jgi:hypothetical protein